MIFWYVKPPANTTTAHVACSRAGTWAAWARLVLAGGLRYEKNIGWGLLLMLQLKFSERLMQFGDIVPNPTLYKRVWIINDVYLFQFMLRT